jgi:hypothetical protein
VSETAASMIVLVGTQQFIAYEEIHVLCNVLDSKYAWGELRLQIQPIGGQGKQWVSANRIRKAVA